MSEIEGGAEWDGGAEVRVLEGVRNEVGEGRRWGGVHSRLEELEGWTHKEMRDKSRAGLDGLNRE